MPAEPKVTRRAARTADLADVELALHEWLGCVHTGRRPDIGYLCERGTDAIEPAIRKLLEASDAR